MIWLLLEKDAKCYIMRVVASALQIHLPYLKSKHIVPSPVLHRILMIDLPAKLISLCKLFLAVSNECRIVSSTTHTKEIEEKQLSLPPLPAQIRDRV